MKVIKIKKENHEILLQELLREQGIHLPADCGGNGTCGTCKVRFVTGAPEPTVAEREKLSQKELEAGWRLACKTVIPRIQNTNTAIEAEIEETNPIIEVEIEEIYLNIEEKGCSSVSKIETEMGLPGISDWARKDNMIKIALDIGTTTLAAAIVDSGWTEPKPMVTSHKITNEEMIAATMNHQKIYGSDVISRIHASNKGYGKELQEFVIKDIEELLRKLGVDHAEFFISCNTTMGHILQGYSCEGLGRAPYTPVDLSYHIYDSMHILPGISTFVGADIVSGMVACDMDQSEKVNLFVDIGTNAEMAIGNRDRILVTSAAAGPAFEGGNLSCGMPGISGAISSLTIERNCETIGDKNIFLCKHIQTIDNAESVGICGSGVLELVYELKKNGLIDETGLLVEEFFNQGFPICNDITFTQKDIREVQQAKAAIRTGIEILIKEYGVTYEQIDRFYLAGSFGQHMNIEKAVGIGLIPAELKDKVVAVGNTSLAGAVMAARDSGAVHNLSEGDTTDTDYGKSSSVIERFRQVSRNAEEILLADRTDFQELYFSNMYL